MEITDFIVSSRTKALLYGNYSSYRTLLARRLLAVRKRLDVATKSRRKCTHRVASIQSGQLADDENYARLLLLTAERAFAQAMAMKASHSGGSRRVSGAARTHIVSRLVKGAKAADHLATLLDATPSAARDDRLEARAYAALLHGAAAFERQAWGPCLARYAAAWAVYRALSSAAPARADVFRDLLADTLEPALRYAAYQLAMPRSKPIPVIAREALLPEQADFVDTIDAIDATTLSATDVATDAMADSTADTPADATALSLSHSLVWRGRRVTVEDAAVAGAWAALGLAKTRLLDTLQDLRTTASAEALAAAYDDVLAVAQDAVDAAKAAIDDLRRAGVPQGDAALQQLYVARTAAHYELLDSRIGRNRELMGANDGAVLPPAGHDSHSGGRRRRPDPATALLARLKTCLVLYDSTLQSLDAAQALPGVAADDALAAQLTATARYFDALRALALARSHAAVGHAANALALLLHARDACAEAVPVLALSSDGEEPAVSARSLRVSPGSVRGLQRLLQAELLRTHALAVMQQQQQQQQPAATNAAAAQPLGESLAEYHAVDLANIVAYPPRLQPMPVKPIFLDLAWNYIGYPSKGGAVGGAAAAAAPAAAAATATAAQEKKRGWFGFTR